MFLIFSCVLAGSGHFRQVRVVGYPVSMLFNIGQRSLSQREVSRGCRSLQGGIRDHIGNVHPRANQCSLSARIYVTMDKPEIMDWTFSADPARFFRQIRSLLSCKDSKKKRAYSHEARKPRGYLQLREHVPKSGINYLSRSCSSSRFCHKHPWKRAAGIGRNVSCILTLTTEPVILTF